MKNKIKKLLHDNVGWAFPKTLIELDEFQPVFSCYFCEQIIAQDSTGAWFHLSRSIKTYENKNISTFM